jgi:predicted enzyme related to lactoylglutathione lyase
MMGQPVAMFEITSPQLDRAQKFYAELFDWSIDPDPDIGGYGLVDAKSPDAIMGAIGPVSEGEKAGGKVYIRVDNLAHLDRAEGLGGTRLVEPTALPGEFGSFAIFADPDGNPVGLWS